jgi:Uma2 family endonuclease
MPGTSRVLIISLFARADQREKVPLYARAGIRELWIVNLRDGLVEVYREPSTDGYREIVKLGPGSRLSISAFTVIQLSIDEVSRVLTAG